MYDNRRWSTSTLPLARMSVSTFLYSTRPRRTPMLCMRSDVNSTGVSGGAAASGGTFVVNPSIGGCSAGGWALAAKREDLQNQYAVPANAKLSTNAAIKSLR